MVKVDNPIEKQIKSSEHKSTTIGKELEEEIDHAIGVKTTTSNMIVCVFLNKIYMIPFLFISF